jgi:hypothetical protein
MGSLSGSLDRMWFPLSRLPTYHGTCTLSPEQHREETNVHYGRLLLCITWRIFLFYPYFLGLEQQSVKMKQYYMKLLSAIR